LVLADLQTLQKRLPVVEKEAKANPKLLPKYAVFKKAFEQLNSGKILRQSNDEWRMTNEDEDNLKELQMLTVKPIIYVFNVDEQTLTDENMQKKLGDLVLNNETIFICAKLEDELKSLEATEADELLDSYGVKESGLIKLINAAYKALGLQSYLTAGEKEVRAWTIKAGSTAPQAAGVIHGDFERGFIAADIVDYYDLLNAGSWAAARSSGKLRTEGKTYIMQPNDVVEFRFNI
jgi:ribosome-binding ATPase